VLKLEGIAFIYWAIKCTPKASFVMVLKLEKTTFIYWEIECTQKLDIYNCSNLKELLSFIK
jgi:hypothetical protein